MNISFVLRDSKKKDGTKRIRCYIRHNGKAYYNTKYSVRENEWKGGSVKESRPNAIQINAALIRLRNDVEALCIQNPLLSAGQIKDLINKGSIHTFLAFFESFIKECESGKHKRSIGTVKNYRKVLKSFIGEESYEPFPYLTDFGIINKKWYDNYVSWLRAKGQNENTVGSYIKIIKMVINEAHDRGVTTVTEHRKKYFKKPSQEAESIYLTEEEMKLWANADLNEYKHLEKERDRFLIQYYFLGRFGDATIFSKNNFYKEDGNIFIRFRAGKTAIETIVPVNPKAYEILLKYNFNLDTTNQEANRNLKTIGALAGISPIKANKITTHTARRSGATNLFLQGCPDKIIMDLGGWKKVEQFRDYIKLTKLESAKKALSYDFFK